MDILLVSFILMASIYPTLMFQFGTYGFRYMQNKIAINLYDPRKTAIFRRKPLAY